MDWQRLKIFYQVATAGSLARASKTLNRSKPALSRQIALLEESLNVKLFHRHVRGLLLTEQGELLYRTAKETFARLALAEAVLLDNKDRVTGQLKVTTSIGFGAAWLSRQLIEFYRRYPEVAVELVVDDRDLDLAMREADVAIRMSPPQQPDLIQRKLMSVGYGAYASPAYLKSRGAPERASDLDDHCLVTWGPRNWSRYHELNWVLRAGARRGTERRPVLSTNNMYAAFQAVMSGLGICAFPDYMAWQMSDLVRVLPDHKVPIFNACFLYPEELRHSRRIAAFRDFLLEKIAEQRALWNSSATR